MLRKHWQVCALFTLACSTACSGGDEGREEGLASGGTSGGSPPASTGGSETTSGGSPSSTGGNPGSTGGALGSGGSATGGANTGGTAAGGSNTGGMNPSSGGKSGGSSNTGGSASGNNTGGTNTSGTNSGGSSTGGKGQGGSSTGGKGQGGTNTSSGGTSNTGGAATGGSAGGGTCPEIETQLCGMVAQHNAARASVMPVPTTPLPEMTWNTAAATAAQSWADQCMFSHNTQGYGQNLYASAGSGAPTPKAVVDSWVSEAKDYNYAANTCSGVCGHYTQVVWRSSIGVGCAVKACSVNSPFSGFPNWYIVVCNYSPAGNFNNQKPY